MRVSRIDKKKPNESAEAIAFRKLCISLLDPEKLKIVEAQLLEDWKAVYKLGLDSPTGKRITMNEYAFGHLYGVRRGMAWGWDLATRKKTEPRETILGILMRNSKISNEALCKRLDSLGRADVRPAKAVPAWGSFVGPQGAWLAVYKSKHKNKLEVYFSRIRDMVQQIQTMDGWKKRLRKMEDTTKKTRSAKEVSDRL